MDLMVRRTEIVETLGLIQESHGHSKEVEYHVFKVYVVSQNLILNSLMEIVTLKSFGIH